jgi:hypothetical protein
MLCLRPTVCVLAPALWLGCAPAKPPDPSYDPARSLLEVVAVLRLHVPDDTYRFEPARDFTGRNVYRGTLLRLENLERAHADDLRAGHMQDVIYFSKGRALERLRAYDLAAASYREVIELGGPLERPARKGAALCDALAEASSLGAVREEEEAEESIAFDADRVLEAYELRVALLKALAEEEASASHYDIVIQEEIEQADMDRAERFVEVRNVLPDGDLRALAELQRVVVRHRESSLANQHLLDLADLYAELAEEYVEDRPPEGLHFDPPAFEELVDSASHLYQAVANQDGTTEKLEAQRRLESFLAFTLQVDRDRFSE